MHACGHDGHAAISLAVARMIKPMLETARGKLQLLFRRAEEGGCGGRAVADAGWMDDVDLFYAIHLGLGVRSDTANFAVHGLLANARYDPHLTGRAAYAGKASETGRSALQAACQIALGLHTMAQSSRPQIRVNVRQPAAGTAVNIVPVEARLSFEMRAEDTADLHAFEARSLYFVAATAQAHGMDCRPDPGSGADSYANPSDIASLATQVNAATQASATVLPALAFEASEDAATPARRAVARGGHVGIFALGADLADDHHTPYFDFDENALTKPALLCAGLIASALDAT